MTTEYPPTEDDCTVDAETTVRTSGSPDGSDYVIYECQTAGCDNVILAVGSDDPPMACHDEPMVRVTDCEMDVNTPDLRQVLLDAFGLPKIGLDVCLCVIGQGPLSPGEVAEGLGYERSTVSEYLNTLVDAGLLKKSQLNREGGGVVNVYHAIDLQEMRRETIVGFYRWAGEAATLLEEANATKAANADGDHGEELQHVFWESFKDDS